MVFKTIKNNVSAEIIEKKSKFIANLFYIQTQEEAEDIIKKIKKKYFDAKHNCIAYRVVTDNEIYEKSSDDGEPSGTAGAPMLNILKKNELANVLIVVTRYFGGILLGTGGLVRAYSDSLLLAIEKAEKVEKCLGEIIKIEIDYKNFESFKYYCKKEYINIVEPQYLEDIICKIEIEQVKKEEFFNTLKKKGIITKKKEFLTKTFITKK